MGHYIVRRLLQAIPMLIMVSIVLFALVNIAPGGPMSAYSRTNRMPAEKKEAIRRSFGLDKPLPVQYIVWLVGNDWMADRYRWQWGHRQLWNPKGYLAW